MTTLTQLEEGRNHAAKAEFSEKTADFLKWLQTTLRQRGWVRTDARNQSALYNWTFQRGEREIAINGWHGTGQRGTSRWYGDLKTVFSLFDNRVDGGVCLTDGRTRMVFDFSAVHGTVDEHDQHLKAIRAYIQTNA